MRITTLFGLPAHVFFVHIPIILIPLAAVGAVLMLWPSMRRRFGLALVVVVGAAVGATVFATQSGKALREYVPESSLVREHTRIGEELTKWAALLFLLVVAVVVWDWWTRRSADARAADGATAGTVEVAGHRLTGLAAQRIGLGLSALAVLVAGVSTYWVYRIGHTGAKASWSVVQHRIDTGQRVGGEGREGGG